MDGERRQERVLGGNFQPSHNIRGPGIGWRMEVFYIICTMTTNACCAECGEEGSVSLKACKACMLVKYCNSSCQHKHWANHKTACKLRAAELSRGALQGPNGQGVCPICFLPMPVKFLLCTTMPDATISSVPIYNFAKANRELAIRDTDTYYSCCGKTFCGGCLYSFRKYGNNKKCPFCNSERGGKTLEEVVEE